MNDKERVVVVGAGRLCEILLPYVVDIYDVVLICDGHPRINSENLRGYIVEPISKIDKFGDLRVIVCSMYFQDIYGILTEQYRVAKNKVFWVYDDELISFKIIKEFICGTVFEKSRAYFKRVCTEAPSKNFKKELKLFVMESLGGGGAEHAFVQLLERIIEKEGEKIVVLILDAWDKEQYFLPNSCLSFNLFCSQSEAIKSRYLFKFMAAEELYGLIVGQEFVVSVSFLEGRSTKLVAGAQGKRVSWIHTDLIRNPWDACFYKTKDERTETYLAMDAVVCVSASVKASAISAFNLPKSKLEVVPNFIDDLVGENFDRTYDTELVKLFNSRKKIGCVFLAVGRLTEAKGFERLIRSFARSKNRSSLIIIGDGHLRRSLDDLVISLSLDDRVFLVGYRENAMVYMKYADALISSSYFEGAPLVIEEAIVQRCPVIATNCQANREALNGGDWGELVDDSEYGLATAINRYSSSKSFKESLTYKASQASIVKDWSVIGPKIMDILTTKS